MAKGAFFVVTALTIVLSYSVLGFAVVDLRLLKQYKDQDEGSVCFLSDICIVLAGLLCIIISSFGILAIIKENLKYISKYMCYLLLMTLLEVALGIFVAIQRNGLQYKVSEWIRDEFFHNVTHEEQVQHDSMWNDLQTQYQCCGLNGPEDYAAIQQPISLSCCSRAYRARTQFAQKQLYAVCIQTMSYYSQGCEDEMIDMLRADGEWLLGTAISMLWLQGIGMVLCSWVVYNINNKVQVYMHTEKF